MANKLILNISHVNPKSLDIEFGASPLGIRFSLYNEDDSFKVGLNLFKSSIDSTLSTLFISTEDEDTDTDTDTDTDDSLLMSPSTNYILKAFKGETLVDSFKVSFVDFPAPLLPKVSAYGNRLLEIQFEYPIKHLDDDAILSSTLETVPVGSPNPTLTHGNKLVYALSNFYVKYFKEDSNQSNTPSPKWPGYIIPKVTLDPSSTSPVDEILVSNPFTILQSDDQRTILIQSNVRSLPIGFHNLQVATSKIADHTLSGLHLADFMQRDVPISEVEFELKGAQYSAIVSTIFIRDPQTVEVMFNTPVLDSSGKITVDSISSLNQDSLNYSVSVARKPGTLDTLIFKMEANTFIAPGANNITISGIVDCFGLLVNDYKYPFNFELPEPVILSILQDKSIEDGIATKVDVVFSHPMKEDSVSEKENYSIFSKQTSTTVTIGNIIFSNLDPTNASFEFTPQLASGDYSLTATNVVDVYGSPLKNIPYDFSIIDTTRPTVATIIGTNEENPDLNDTILIKFSETMASNSEHGIDKGINFKLAVDGVNFKTLETSTVTLLKNNTWARFNLKELVKLIAFNPSSPNAQHSLVKVGYVGLNKIFFITDSSSNIVEFCSDKKITKLLPILSLDNGIASITDYNQITYTLPNTIDPDASFNIIAFKEDFIFKADDSDPLKISSVVVSEDLKSLVFTFDNVIFSSGTDYLMSLNSVSRDILSEDILNRPITLTDPITVTNNLRPEVVSISTVWVDNVSEPNEAILALRLSSPINVTHVNDFLVYNRNNLRLNVSKATITNETTGLPSDNGRMLEIYCKSPLNTNALANDLSVSTAPEAYRITGFYTNVSYNKLKSIESYPSTELYPITSNVTLGADLFTSKFEVTFTEPIDIIAPRNSDGTISVTGVLMSTEGPSSLDPTQTEPFATLHFDNIFELRSNIRSYEGNPIVIRDGTDLKPSFQSDAFAPIREIIKSDTNYTINATLTLKDSTLSIAFTNNNTIPSDIVKYFSYGATSEANNFVLFELLPLGYNLFGTVSKASLNESITVKFPFGFKKLS